MAEPIRDKQARLHRLSHLLYRHPEGLTVREMARLCGGVSRRTIQRDLKTLETSGVPIWQDDKGEKPSYGIIDGYYLPPLQLSLNEATVLYLAARLLSRNVDEHNPTVVQAFAQLATVLPENLARPLQDTIKHLASQDENPEFRSAFETLALAWATGRKVRIWYRAARNPEPREHVLSPYFIEPGNKALYVVGHSDQYDSVITFKLERITEARLLDDTFEIPEEFMPAQVLADSWGIFWGEPLEEVVLKFSPDVARRVDENVWHPSQQVKKLPDGGRELRIEVSGTLEIEPWIKGWGPSVEVLAPEELRHKMAAEAREMAQVYSDVPDE